MADDNLSKNRTRRQTGVLWDSTAQDDYGRWIAGEPREIKCRIEEGIEEALDRAANIAAAELHINVGERIPVGSFFLQTTLAELAALTEEQTLYQVISYESIPCVRQRRYDRWIKLIYSGTRIARVEHSLFHDSEADTLVHDGTEVIHSSLDLV